MSFGVSIPLLPAESVPATDSDFAFIDVVVTDQKTSKSLCEKYKFSKPARMRENREHN